MKQSYQPTQQQTVGIPVRLRAKDVGMLLWTQNFSHHQVNLSNVKSHYNQQDLQSNSKYGSNFKKAKRSTSLFRQQEEYGSLLNGNEHLKNALRAIHKRKQTTYGNLMFSPQRNKNSSLRKILSNEQKTQSQQLQEELKLPDFSHALKLDQLPEAVEEENNIMEPTSSAIDKRDKLKKELMKKLEITDDRLLEEYMTMYNSSISLRKAIQGDDQDFHLTSGNITINNQKHHETDDINQASHNFLPELNRSFYEPLSKHQILDTNPEDPIDKLSVPVLDSKLVSNRYKTNISQQPSILTFKKGRNSLGQSLIRNENEKIRMRLRERSSVQRQNEHSRIQFENRKMMETVTNVKASNELSKDRLIKSYRLHEDHLIRTTKSKLSPRLYALGKTHQTQIKQAWRSRVNSVTKGHPVKQVMHEQMHSKFRQSSKSPSYDKIPIFEEQVNMPGYESMLAKVFEPQEVYGQPISSIEKKAMIRKLYKAQPPVAHLPILGAYDNTHRFKTARLSTERKTSKSPKKTNQKIKLKQKKDMLGLRHINIKPSNLDGRSGSIDIRLDNSQFGTLQTTTLDGETDPNTSRDKAAAPYKTKKKASKLPTNKKSLSPRAAPETRSINSHAQNGKLPSLKAGDPSILAQPAQIQINIKQFDRKMQTIKKMQREQSSRPTSPPKLVPKQQVKKMILSPKKVKTLGQPTPEASSSRQPSQNMRYQPSHDKTNDSLGATTKRNGGGELQTVDTMRNVDGLKVALRQDVQSSQASGTIVIADANQNKHQDQLALDSQNQMQTLGTKQSNLKLEEKVTLEKENDDGRFEDKAPVDELDAERKISNEKVEEVKDDETLEVIQQHPIIAQASNHQDQQPENDQISVQDQSDGIKEMSQKQSVKSSKSVAQKSRGKKSESEKYSEVESQQYSSVQEAEVASEPPKSQSVKQSRSQKSKSIKSQSNSVVESNGGYSSVKQSENNIDEEDLQVDLDGDEPVKSSKSKVVSQKEDVEEQYSEILSGHQSSINKEKISNEQQVKESNKDEKASNHDELIENKEIEMSQNILQGSQKQPTTPGRYDAKFDQQLKDIQPVLSLQPVAYTSGDTTASPYKESALKKLKGDDSKSSKKENQVDKEGGQSQKKISNEIVSSQRKSDRNNGDSEKKEEVKNGQLQEVPLTIQGAKKNKSENKRSEQRSIKSSDTQHKTADFGENVNKQKEQAKMVLINGRKGSSTSTIQSMSQSLESNQMVQSRATGSEDKVDSASSSGSDYEEDSNDDSDSQDESGKTSESSVQGLATNKKKQKAPTQEMIVVKESSSEIDSQEGSSSGEDYSQDDSDSDSNDEDESLSGDNYESSEDQKKQRNEVK